MAWFTSWARSGGIEHGGQIRLQISAWISDRSPARVSNRSMLPPAVALVAELMNDVRRTADVPAVFLSLYGHGRADYLVKPFSPTGLESFAGEPSPPYDVGGLTIEYEQRRVVVNGEPVKLTATEYAVLYELAVHAPRALRPAVLLQRVWGPERLSKAWLLRDVVKRLRRKLGDNGSNPKYVITEPGAGYRMPIG